MDARNAQKWAQAKFASSQSPALKIAIEALKPLIKGIGMFECEALIRYLVNESRVHAKRSAPMEIQLDLDKIADRLGVNRKKRNRK